MRINKDVEKSADTLKKQMTKKKKRLLIILGIILAVLIAVTAFLIIPNLGNIKAAWIWLTTSKEDIEVKLSENKQQQADAMVNAGLSGASTEAIDALNKGEITHEQFSEILLGKTTLEDALGKTGNLNITEEAVNALETGEITGEQFIMIAEQQTTLEDVRKTNSETVAPKEEETDTETDKTESVVEGTPVDEAEKVTSSETKQDTPVKQPDKPAVKEEKQPEEKEPTKKPQQESKPAENDKTSEKKPAADTETSKDEKIEPAFSQQVIDAYKSGEITDSQLVDIGKGNITLEQAISDNASTNKTPSQVTQPGTQVPQNKDDQVTPPSANGDSTKNESSEQKNPSSSSASADEKIAAVVTKMYVLKSEYEGSVAAIVESMKSEFAALPAGQRTTSAKSSIASRYMGTINSMEAQCDAQVNAIVSELRQVLSANGRDMSLADSILSTYAAEKENTKAYYLSQYGD